jgi:uncharacterized protein (TIGR01244 family)
MKPVALLTLVAALAIAGCATSPVPAALPAIAEVGSPAPGIVVAGRLRPEDVARVRDAGLRHVVDLTPDSETPDFDEATAIRAAGLEYSNLPLRGAPDLTRDNVLAFDTLLRAAKRPVLVHCSSGNRVGAMAALRAAWVDGKSLEEAVATGRAWGLKGLESEVRQRIAADRVSPTP